MSKPLWSRKVSKTLITLITSMTHPAATLASWVGAWAPAATPGNEFKDVLLEHMKIQQKKTDAMLREFEHVKINVEKVVTMLNKPRVTDEVIRMIKPDEVKYEHPKEPFMTTPTSVVYRGQYHGFAVVIKRYRDQMNASPREIRSVFNKEVETMRRFESPNILRMFGICVQDEDDEYNFGIIMWEVATRKRPFEGCSGEEIYKKVYEERYQEPLPDDCPEPLGHLINTCRAYDSFQRPSAGVLVDKLRTLVAQLEEQ
ncbi:mixed lineage kinase domain-like protein [Lates japonicus]|uniref:Mixed lineage kinase domain-like protein n=1 Tax=Lates japonicus TaxID=270547 RepID=A0AAD3R3R8_LATJO|nr:mixed lineage kinase domain-like protein [Lates japonicus]